MKQEMKHTILIAALLGLALAGCQKKEEAPAPEVAPETAPETTPGMAPEAPAPLSEPMAPSEPVAPSDTTPPQEPPPAGDMPATPPAQ